MSRNAFLLLLGLGTLTASWSRADESEPAQKPSSDAVIADDSGDLPVEEDVEAVSKPEYPVSEEPTSPGEAEILEMEPLVTVTSAPEGESTDYEEVRRDIVELASPPEGSQILEMGAGNEERMYASQVGGSNIQNTPEPSTLLLASLGAALIGVRACRRRFRPEPKA